MESNEHTRQRASVDPGDPLVGRLLDGRYRVLRRVARGGMAAVYEAVDERLDRTVAVKVMHPGMGDGNDFAERFVREARAAARLSHPNVVAVHDQGEDDGVVYLAMEYVPGRTLRDVVTDEAPLSPVRALAWVEPVLAALSAAHRTGLVHRDVKPENVLITTPADGEAPQVKVADFGLAKAVDATTQHTATGVVIGSVSYLAPELVVQGRVDARVDVYAVGVVLYELLTGRKPHDGESQIQVAYKHVHEDVPAPSAAVPGIPGFVDALVARATARDSDQRPADAGVLLRHVRRALQALREGVTDDPELEEDLRPHPVVAPLDVEVEADELGALAFSDDHDAHRARVYEDEAATAVAPAAVATAAAPVEHTQQLSALAPGALTAEPAEARAVPEEHAVRRLPPPSADVPSRGAGRRRSRRGPLALVLALLLVVGVGVGAWWFGFARYTTTPSVLELDQQAAVAALEDAGFTAEVGDPTYHEEIAKGQVAQTDPAPGERVLEGGTVTLVLSLGPERYDVPDLVGRSLDEAQAALEETKLAYGRKVEKYSDTVEAGKVISTNPEAGTTVRPDTAVNVTVSKGRKPVEVSDFTGKKAADAEARMKEQGLVVTREEKFSDDVAEGVVISQSPKSGTVFKGDEVTLVVSKGPELVQVPRVIAQGVEAARKKLQDLGFEVKVENSNQYLGLGFVLNTDPGPGSKAPKGSTITLFLI